LRKLCPLRERVALEATAFRLLGCFLVHLLKTSSTVLPVPLYEYEIHLTLREEHRLKVPEYRVLRRIYGAKQWREAAEDCIARIFITCTLHHIVRVKEDEMDGACSTHERDEKFKQNFGREL
jgi:hypothetical protein